MICRKSKIQVTDPPIAVGARGRPVPQLPRFIPYAAILVFGAGCVVSLRHDLTLLSLEPLLRAWDVVLLATSLSLLNYLLRILRWRSYLRALGHPLPHRFVVFTYLAGFAYTLSPGKVGEMVRARYYLPLGVKLSDVAGAFFAERLMDLIVMVVLAALLFTAEARYTHAIVVAAALAALALAVAAFAPWTALLPRVRNHEWIPAILRTPTVALLSALDSTRPLLRPGILAWGFAAGLAAWGFEGLGLRLLGGIYPAAHLNVSTAVGIYGVAVLVGGLSLLPGGLGSTEAVMTALLAGHGYPLGTALLVTLACRLVTLWFAVCLGWMAVAILGRQSMAPVT